MSLAMYAAPFNNNDYMDKVNDTDTPIGRKKNANNKTQKRYYTTPPKDNNNTDKINNILTKGISKRSLIYLSSLFV